MKPRLYADLADWWPLVSPAADYADEAKLYAEQLCSGRPHAPRLQALELGCGGGHCALHMRAFDWTFSDLSPEMLAACRRLHPDRPHVPGDMRTLRLGSTFDAVFVHDAISYMTTRTDLEAACRTAFVHCRPGGTALLAPDWTAETFAPGTDHGGADDDADNSNRGLRFLEWVHPAVDGVAAVDFVFVLREGGQTRVVHDRHAWGVFPREVWLDVLRAVGFTPEQRLAGEGDDARWLFVARRPPA